MIDLKAIQLKEFAKVTKVELLSREEVEKIFLPTFGTALPLVLRIQGENFDNATDVLINGNQVQFTTLSKSTILATLSNAVRSSPITSISVLNDRENFSNSSLFTFEVGSRPGTVSGINKVIFQYVKVLLTTPGSDSFDKQFGGGLQKIPGSTSRAPYAFLTKTALTLVNVANEIRQRQFNLDIPNEEKLQSIEVLYIDFAKGDPSSIEVKLKVNTLAQSNLPVSLTLGVQGLLEDLTGAVGAGNG
jgi:hypothetical protein